MTMVRPKTLGEEKEDSEEEEEEIQIVLTSKNPNETSGLIRWAICLTMLCWCCDDKIVSDGIIQENIL